MMGLRRASGPSDSNAVSHRVRGWRIPQFGHAPTMDSLVRIAPSRVALLGRDFPGTRLDVLVEEGDSVAPGDVVMRDRRHPDIAFTASAGGVVSRIRRGARRALETLEIRVSGEPPAKSFAIAHSPGSEDIRHLMLESGIWTAMRTRPFGYLPLPGEAPAALFVTAIETRPLAPDPKEIIALHPDWFSAGLGALSTLTSAPVYLCAPPDAAVSFPGDGDIRLTEFAGPHPAGLPGIHIQACCPVGGGNRSVWQINYSDVMSLGRLLLEGVPWFDRFIAVAGPGLSNPCMVSTIQGAVMSDVLTESGLKDDALLIAGSPIDGSLLDGPYGFLGQRQSQLTALPESTPFLSPAKAGAWPLLPTTDLDKHAPPGVLAAPLLRALLVGDANRARELGALELLEEDLAGISAISSTGTDFGPPLRQCLDRIAREEV